MATLNIFPHKIEPSELKACFPNFQAFALLKENEIKVTVATDGHFTGVWICGGKRIKSKLPLGARVKLSNRRLTSSDAPERLRAAEHARPN